MTGKKLAALGMALMVGGGLVAGATPAAAQATCSQPLYPVCSLVLRQVQHVLDEAERVPEYIAHVEQTAYTVYDWADGTVRCVVFQECS